MLLPRSCRRGGKRKEEEEERVCFPLFIIARLGAAASLRGHDWREGKKKNKESRKRGPTRRVYYSFPRRREREEKGRGGRGKTPLLTPRAKRKEGKKRKIPSLLYYFNPESPALQKKKKGGKGEQGSCFSFLLKSKGGRGRGKKKKGGRISLSPLFLEDALVKKKKREGSPAAD